MLNLKKMKNPMPEQSPEVRIDNFDEVAQGYTAQMAINEAMRCSNCRKKPCTEGCPVKVRIPEFIAKVAEGNFEAAYKIISDTSALPAVCGRVCPQENQCEGSCVQGIMGEPVAIGRLERFVADWHAEHAAKFEEVEDVIDEEMAENFSDENKKELQGAGHKVAVVGAGPAGLACAGDLAVKGYDVTVFDAYHKSGGILTYGIPGFRLPNSIVEDEVYKLEKLGVDFINGVMIGETKTVDELLEEGYEAVFLGVGAGKPMSMNIPGEDLKGVWNANAYLAHVNSIGRSSFSGEQNVRGAKVVAVIGGGNVAMDASRAAIRMGAEKVYIIYRRSMDEMPAAAAEIHEALDENVEFLILKNPISIIGNEEGDVTGLECVEMELGAPDASGRRRPIERKGTNFVLDVDCVIMAIGSQMDNLVVDTTAELEINASGWIGADENAVTNRPEVFAGGDAVTGPATVVMAMGAGKKAASSIDEFIMNKMV